MPGRGRDRTPGRDGGAAAGRARLAAAARCSSLDDLTPLMRAQKVAAWGEVARKLAHEIKNPLTPIQLSAQRVRKAYLRARPTSSRCSQECTGAIVSEVDALKNLVDEFAQFARLPAANLVAGVAARRHRADAVPLRRALRGRHHGAPAGAGRARRCASTPTR